MKPHTFWLGLMLFLSPACVVFRNQILSTSFTLRESRDLKRRYWNDPTQPCMDKYCPHLKGGFEWALCMNTHCNDANSIRSRPRDLERDLGHDHSQGQVGVALGLCLRMMCYTGRESSSSTESCFIKNCVLPGIIRKNKGPKYISPGLNKYDTVNIVRNTLNRIAQDFHLKTSNQHENVNTKYTFSSDDGYFNDFPKTQLYGLPNGFETNDDEKDVDGEGKIGKREQQIDQMSFLDRCGAEMCKNLAGLRYMRCLSNYCRQDSGEFGNPVSAEEILMRKRRINDDVSQCIQSYCGAKNGMQERLVCIVNSCHNQKKDK